MMPVFKGRCKPCRDQRPPKDGDCEQPRRLTLAPVEVSQDEHGNGRKQRREEEPDQEYPHRLGVKRTDRKQDDGCRKQERGDECDDHPSRHPRLAERGADEQAVKRRIDGDTNFPAHGSMLLRRARPWQGGDSGRYVTDASDTFNKTTRDAAWSRMEAAGSQLMSRFGTACELHRD